MEAPTDLGLTDIFWDYLLDSPTDICPTDIFGGYLLGSPNDVFIDCF
jgi:hypothetical protein